MNEKMTATELLSYIPARPSPDESDYVLDGLVYCGKCRTPRQIRLTIDGLESIFPCLCYCRETSRDAEEARHRERDRLNRINDLRVNGIADRAARGMTFDIATDSPGISKARKYVKNWASMKKTNTGLLMFGGTGTGKTFAAACIANALIDNGTTVLMTSFPKILSAIQSMNGEDRNEYINSLDEFSLLVLDDLGAERQSQYALEVVYTVIDNRYKAGKPLIITTNLGLSDMKNPENMDYQRIYDRILEICVPLKFDGESMRKRAAAEKLKAAAELLKED